MAMFVYFTFGELTFLEDVEIFKEMVSHCPFRFPIKPPLKGHPSFNLWPHSVLLLGRKHWEGELLMRSGTTWWICFENKTGPCKISGIPIDQEFANYIFFLFLSVIVKEIFKKHHLQFQMTTVSPPFFLKRKTL